MINIYNCKWIHPLTILVLEIEVNYFESIYQRNNFSVVHHLLFNVTALPIEEHLQEAELKLWAIIHFSPENLLGSLKGNIAGFT